MEHNLYLSSKAINWMWKAQQTFDIKKSDSDTLNGLQA